MPTTGNSVQTSLSIHPDWDLSMQEQYVYRFHHQQLSDLQPNQLQISGFKLEEFEEFFSISAFIRSSLPKAIKFELLNLLVLDENKKVLARETFDMERFGELPGNSARPWRFIFENETKETDEPMPTEGWTIAFELKKREEDLEDKEHSLELDASWEQSITQEQKKHLMELLNKIPPLKQNEVNFMGIEAKVNPENNLVVTLLIRNGSLKNVQIEQLPLVVEDASGEVVAKGVFKLDNFQVSANTSKPWTFIFPSHLLLKENPDLSQWRVYPPKG